MRPAEEGVSLTPQHCAWGHPGRGGLWSRLRRGQANPIPPYTGPAGEGWGIR